MFRRVVLLTAAALALTVGTAVAANPHFIGEPTFTDLGTTLQSSGSIAGLGNQDVTIVLDAEGVASVTCTNKGGTQAPGQQKVIDVSGSVSNLRPENGRVNFTVTTADPNLSSGSGNTKSDGCPNGNWTSQITDVTFTSATLSVYQRGVLVLQETFIP